MKRISTLFALLFIFYAAHATQPAITAVAFTTGSGTYKVGDNIDMTVTFDQLVSVANTPRIALNAGGGAFANYLSGSGSATLTFRYTVGAGQSAGDLDYTA